MKAEERLRAVSAFGFTERQAGFLVTVMQHSGVCLGRHYCAFSGLTHGQKVHDFLTRLLESRMASGIAPCGTPLAIRYCTLGLLSAELYPYT